MAEIKAAGLLVYRILNVKILYLLLQSSRNPHHWTPPKGHLEPNETDLEAAYRETEEESGLKKDHLRIHVDPIPIHYQTNGKPKIVTYWLAELTDHNAQVTISFEHQDFKWAEFEEAKKLMKYENGVALLNTAHELIKAKRPSLN